MGLLFQRLRHNRRRRITRRAGRGDNLFASHPTPFVPGQRRFALLRDSAGPDLNENDPFVATSPRVSGTFGGYGRGAESHGSSGYDYDDVAADGGPTHETDAAFGGYSRYAGYDDAYNSYDVHGLPSGAGEAHAGQGGQHTISHTAQSSMVTATNTIADEPKMPEPRVPGT
ncbi:hypothetical protein K437DRAFT_255391 [Tilletiaria anomala UBC 951]|uniref:Uncharacterized protein n=1 Tax=Tilletiaria anomala (strain ATCC 24038 / CBS 436.72 / UBC 951) TaxID=1037660 RepID=A0A066W8L4_TILAU|nr:uncharacterized protein K437DRAFT_255391 [Tilletiaria anomala UBC 951]KDN48843.1 hypothetical protein K437DRAFT_255391 [Tilletiaria anomala UBC 951]